MVWTLKGENKICYLTTLNLVKFLNKDVKKLVDKDFIPLIWKLWMHTDFVFNIYILNGLDNTFYDMYSYISSENALWKVLDWKYKVENVTMKKKNIVDGFLDFEIIDSSIIIIWIQEFILVLYDIHAQKIVMDKSFQMTIIIENFLPSWKDFKNYLKYKQKNIGVEVFILRLNIKKNNKLSKRRVNLFFNRENMIEKVTKSKKKKIVVKGKVIAKITQCQILYL